MPLTHRHRNINLNNASSQAPARLNAQPGVANGPNATATPSFYLSELFENTIADCTSSANRKHLRLITSIQSSPVTCCHAQPVSKILHLLVQDAIDFSPPGGLVMLTQEYQVDSIAIVVSDASLGIPSGERKRILSGHDDSDAQCPGASLRIEHLRSANLLAQKNGIVMSLSDNNPGLRVELRFRSPLRV